MTAVDRIYRASSLGVIALVVASTVARTETGSSHADVTERVPVIVELFTSEGCSSCPPADDALTKLAATQPVPGVEIIALGEHVDYWDRLGWRDPFSSARFSARQSEYASKVFHTRNIYTPQMVVDGREELVGSDYRAATTTIARAARLQGPRLRITLNVDHNPSESSAIEVTLVAAPVGTPLASAAEIFLAVAEDGLVTQVRRGENGGRQLRHSAVVRSLTSVGSIPANLRPWSATTTLQLSSAWNVDRSRVVAFVQDPTSKRILGAAVATYSGQARP
jgi:hypothetical protein